MKILLLCLLSMVAHADSVTNERHELTRRIIVEDYRGVRNPQELVDAILKLTPEKSRAKLAKRLESVRDLPKITERGTEINFTSRGKVLRATISGDAGVRIADHTFRFTDDQDAVELFEEIRSHLARRPASEEPSREIASESDDSLPAAGFWVAMSDAWASERAEAKIHANVFSEITRVCQSSRAGAAASDERGRLAAVMGRFSTFYSQWCERRSRGNTIFGLGPDKPRTTKIPEFESACAKSTPAFDCLQDTIRTGKHFSESQLTSLEAQSDRLFRSGRGGREGVEKTSSKTVK